LDDEEMEAMLRGLRGALAQAGFRVGGGSREAALENVDAPDSGDVPGPRGELLRLLDLYEEVLVLAPKSVAATIGLLEAASIQFATDRSDTRFAADIRGRIGRATDGEGGVAGVTITADALDEWMEVASRAAAAIAEIRRRLDEDDRR
jgi:hypothetical protein